MKWFNVAFSLHEKDDMMACAGSGDLAIMFYSLKRSLRSKESNDKLKQGYVRLLIGQCMSDTVVDDERLYTHKFPVSSLDVPFRKFLSGVRAVVADRNSWKYLEIYKQPMFDIESEVIK